MDSSITFIVLWLIAGAIGAWINSAKGKSLGWGFAGGLLFGIFGWIFLALHGTATVACASCRERVKFGATTCRHCGTKFASAAGLAA